MERAIFVAFHEACQQVCDCHALLHLSRVGMGDCNPIGLWGELSAQTRRVEAKAIGKSEALRDVISADGVTGRLPLVVTAIQHLHPQAQTVHPGYEKCARLFSR